MISHEDIQTTLRTYLLTLSVCEATAVDEVTPLTLGASASGYTRTDGGSFITDGFSVGMEVLGAGFTKAANNGNKTVTAVSASLLSCAGCALETASEGPTLEVGVPSRRAWEDVKFEPLVGNPYVVEQYIPGPESAPAAPNDMELFPMYAVHVYVPSNNDIYASARYADALRRHFSPKTKIAVGTEWIRVRADTSTQVGQRVNPKPGFSLVPVTIPLRVRTQITQ
jgi:hypothetical protein